MIINAYLSKTWEMLSNLNTRQHRIALLIESIDSGSHNSKWRERSLSAYTQMEQEIDTMLSFVASTFRVQHNHRANATLCYHACV